LTVMVLALKSMATRFWIAPVESTKASVV